MSEKRLLLEGVLPAAAKPSCLHPLLNPALFLEEGQDGIFLVPVASLRGPPLPTEALGQDERAW